MKKTAWLLCILLVLGAMPVRAAETVISVTTREQLEAIGETPGASYRLDGDIDLGGEAWTPIPFSGTLDGNGHAIYNVTARCPGRERQQTVDGNLRTYDTVFAGLFSSVTHGEIRNLQVLGMDLQVTAGEPCYAGLLTGYLSDTTVENCRIEGRGALYTQAAAGGIGGVAGFGQGQIRDCTVEAELTYGDRQEPDQLPRCEQFLGGLLASGNCTLDDNTVSLRGFASCWGFAHNGGLVGMHYSYDWQDPVGEICRNRVEGTISFFENNTARRAYCQAVAGELLTDYARVEDNETDFHRDERLGETQELQPHSCEKPDFEQIPVAHTQDQFGYVLNRCQTCGYSYKSQYMAPGHVPGDWQTVREPDYEQEGLRQKICTLCGETAQQEVLPKKIPAEQIELSSESLSLRYKEQAVLSGRVLPENASETGVTWESADPEIASVDEEGRVTARKQGSTEIICRSADGFVQTTCPVTVKLSPWQWGIRILLLGWLWY